MSHLTELPILSELIPEGLPVPAVYLVEFEPSSLWYETSFAMAAHAATHGIKADYHSFMRSPSEIREAFRKIGVDVDKLEQKGALRIFDSYTVTTGETPENVKWDANRSINLADWKDNPFQGFGSSYGLHIDDNNSVMLEYNDEKAFIDWLRIHDHLAAESANVLLIHSVVAGVYSPGFYRQAEALASGIIDFKSEEKDGQIQQLVRVRILRGKAHDSRWRRIHLSGDGHVKLVEGREETTTVRTIMPATERRRLASIMFTDMIGYTALGQRNESLSLALVEEQKKIIRPILGRHQGREVKTIGDGILAEFPSALDAVRCSYEIQRSTREFNLSAPSERKLHLRIGIHLGDVVVSHDDIAGDAVNIASRIEALAEDGGVCLTRQVYDHVQNKFELPLTSLGPKSLKNVSSSIEVYKMIMPWDATGPVASTEHDTRRIAILPFANISPDVADEYFADGMTDELIAVLSKIGGLRVVARTSAMRYKGEKATANRIGQELKVGSLVEGSVRKSRNRVRITVQLVDTKSEEDLWSETYDRDLQDIFSVQSDIAQQVAKALELRLGVRESSAIRQQQTQNPEAYSLYLKGRNRWNARSENEINRAIKYFEEAIGRDPRYALAYAGLADCYSILGYYGFRRAAVVYPRAKELAEKALSLNETIAEPHASLGQALMQYYFDWKRAGSELDRALELNPSYATAHFWRATHYMELGQIDDSLTQVRKAVELDPLSMIILTDAARDLYLARRYDESIDQYRRSLEVDPNFPIAHKGLAEVYSQIGKHDEAVSEIEKAITLSGRSIFILDDLGYIYARAGKKEEAIKVLKDLDRIAADEYIPSYGRAVIHAALGNNEEALAWLEKGYEERSFMVYLKVYPAFDILRKDERFVAILNKMGL